MKIQIRLFLCVCTLFVTIAAKAVSPASIAAETLLETKSVLWGFDFLPKGQVLLSERGGRLLIFDPQTKKITAVTGVPKVFNKGQGGLLDIRVHPNFLKNSLVYFSFSEPAGNKATTAVGKARLIDAELQDFKKIFSAEPTSSNDIHFGSRVEFDNTGHIFVSVGDRNERQLAQDKSTHLGKIIKIKEDGTQPEVFSLGHRNPQGLVFDQQAKALWSTEFGPRGGDELNLIKSGKNYGWPIVTFGREYWGPKIGEGTAKPGFENPIAHWVPSISPSALTIYTGDKIPEWKGDFFLANLSGTHIRRLKIRNGQVLEQEELLKDYGRFRNLRTGPDGHLYYSTDDGRFGRLIKAK